MKLAKRSKLCMYVNEGWLVNTAQRKIGVRIFAQRNQSYDMICAYFTDESCQACSLLSKNKMALDLVYLIRISKGPRRGEAGQK